MTISEKIQFYRKKAGLSQEDLAKSLLVSRQTISLWENGQTLPTIDNLIRLREIFDVSIDDMLGAEAVEKDPHGEEQFDESYNVTSHPDELKKIKRSHLLPALSLLAIFGALLSAAIVYGCIKSPESLLLNLILLTISTLSLTAITVTAFYTVHKIKKINKKCGSENHSVYVKINDEALLIERRTDEKLSTISRCPIKDVQSFSLGKDYIEIITDCDSAYLCRKALSDSSRILSLKRSASHSKRIVIIAAAVLLAFVSLFSLDLLLNTPLRRVERYSGVDIPKYEGISENKNIGLTEEIYVDYFAELFLTQDSTKALNETVLTDEAWHSADSESFPGGVLPSSISYRGAEFFAHQEYKPNHHATVLYFADENMLRVVLCRTN